MNERDARFVETAGSISCFLGGSHFYVVRTADVLIQLGWAQQKPITRGNLVPFE